MATPKPGHYPLADRANIFGLLFTEFYNQWNNGGTEDACKPTFRGILNIAKSKADAKFQRHYHAFITVADGHVGEPNEDGSCKEPTLCKKKDKLTVDDMDAIVGEAWGLMDRIGTYDYTGAEFSDETTEVEIDVVSEGGSAKA